MADTTKQPLPLVPRIDRLDSIMKVLEKQKNVARSSLDLSEKKTPMDTAVREAQLKGSLMDRVRALENRLLQLSLEIESRGASTEDTSVFQVLKDATSNHGRGENNTRPSYSSMEFNPTHYYQTIDSPLPPTSRVQTQKLKVKSTTKSEQKKQKNEADSSRKKPTEADKEPKSVTNKKKAKHSTWFYFKLLGC